MSGDFLFEYRVVRLGWAQVLVGDERDDLIVLCSSVAGNRLGELLSAMTSVLNGAPEARCSWHAEPREFRWIMRRAADKVELRVLTFHDWMADEPDDVGRAVFATTQPAVTIAQAFVDAAQRVLDELGEDGYARQWNQDDPFPLPALRDLQRSLAAADADDPLPPAAPSAERPELLAAHNRLGAIPLPEVEHYMLYHPVHTAALFAIAVKWQVMRHIKNLPARVPACLFDEDRAFVGTLERAHAAVQYQRGRAPDEECDAVEAYLGQVRALTEKLQEHLPGDLAREQ